MTQLKTGQQIVLDLSRTCLFQQEIENDVVCWSLMPPLGAPIGGASSWRPSAVSRIAAWLNLEASDKTEQKAGSIESEKYAIYRVHEATDRLL